MQKIKINRSRLLTRCRGINKLKSRVALRLAKLQYFIFVNIKRVTYLNLNICKRWRRARQQGNEICCFSPRMRTFKSRKQQTYIYTERNTKIIHKMFADVIDYTSLNARSRIATSKKCVASSRVLSDFVLV